MPQLDPKTTALVLIDLQKGIMSRTIVPHDSEQIIRRSVQLAQDFRAAGAPVVLVNVTFAKDFADALRQPVDQPTPIPPGGFPEDFAVLVDGLEQPGDILITKRQWGAFHGTELDLQLRRRGITTIVLAGVSTNAGVESTARQAWEHGYRLILLEDACGSTSAEMHAFSITNIMPRLSNVVKAADIRLKA